MILQGRMQPALSEQCPAEAFPMLPCHQGQHRPSTCQQHVFNLPITCQHHLVAQAGRGPNRIERDRMKLALLEEAHIVCSTLSFSGSHIFGKMSRKFDVVVIDEAAQAVEPAILVPLVQGVKQVSTSLLHLPD